MIVELDAAMNVNRRHVTLNTVFSRRDGAQRLLVFGVALQAALDVVCNIARNAVVWVVACRTRQPTFAFGEAA